MKLSKLLRNYQPTPSSTRRARLEVQTLERRENPAGVVNVTFTGSVITLTGDGNPAGNNVQVSATGNDTTPNTSHFLFTGQLGTQFTVNGGAVQGDFDTSTVAGFAFPNNGTTKLNVNLAGPGNDSFDYQGSESATIFPRWFNDVTVNTGEGNDSITLYSMLGRNYTINAGGGDDTVQVYSGAIDGGTALNGGASGSFTANLGTGGDNLDMGISTNKDVKINASDAGDLISVNYNSRIGGNLAINVASGPVLGNSIVGIGNGAAGAGGVSSIAGDLLIKNGKNNLDLGLGLNGASQPLNIGRNLTVVSGSDAVTGSLYALNSVNVGKAISVTGGVGRDRFANGLVISGTSTTFKMGDGGNGAGDQLGLNGLVAGTDLKVTYGSGNDIINIGFADVGRGITIDGGAGADSIFANNIYAGTNFVYNGGEGGNGGIGNPDVFALSGIKGSATISSGGGSDAFNITGLVHKNLTVSSGSGLDTVNLNGITTLGNLSINTGAGNDTINAAGIFVGGTSSFITGADSDILNMTGTSRYQQKVTINLGGSGTDNDALNITPAIVGEEMLMLKGLSVVSGGGVDVLMGGNGAGIVMVHNGATLPGTFIFGNNFFTL